MSKREILWIAPKWPFPAQDGARVATAQLLENLTRRGHAIDLLAVAGSEEKVSAEEARMRLGVRNVLVVRRRDAGGPALRAAWGLVGALATAPRIPLTFRNYHSAEVRDALSRILSGELAPWTVSSPAPTARPDWFGIVYDGLHPAIHSSSGGLFVKPAFPSRVFYRAHNFEADIWSRKAARTRIPPLRWLLNFQAERVRAFEQSLLAQSSGTAPVSDEDWKWLKGLEPAARGRVVPIGHDFGHAPAPLPGSSTLKVLFLGRLDWPPNREGLEWFLREVWPKAAALRPDLELSIAGSGDSSWLAPRLAGLPRAKFLGRVEDLSALYAESSLSLVPIFYGSGTRVKVIEASRFGRACLSTALGVEGTGLSPAHSYIRAETAQEWIDALFGFSLQQARAVGSRAYQGLRETFDAGRASEQFERLLDECA